MGYVKIARASMGAQGFVRIARAEILAQAPPPSGAVLISRAAIVSIPPSTGHVMIARAALKAGAGVDAGANQIGVEPYTQVVLTGGDSFGSVSRVWTQLSGPTVTLVGTGKTRTFEAPGVPGGCELEFGYSADGSAVDLVRIGVQEPTELGMVAGTFVGVKILANAP